MRRSVVALPILYACAAALVVAACSGGPGSPLASTSPSAAAPSEAVGPSLSAAPQPEGAQLPIRVCCTALELEAGQYVMPRWFGIPLSLELGEGWRGIRDDKGRQVNLVRGKNEVGHGTVTLGPYAIPTEDVEAFVAELRATPLLTFEDAVPVEVAGLQAEQIDAQAEPNPAEPGSGSRLPGTVDILAMRLLHSPGISDFAWFTESMEARLRFILVEVGDNTLVVYIEASPDEFDAFADLAQSVLDTILVYPRS